MLLHRSWASLLIVAQAWAVTARDQAQENFKSIAVSILAFCNLACQT
jgi:hypothetical protein